MQQEATVHETTQAAGGCPGQLGFSNLHRSLLWLTVVEGGLWLKGGVVLSHKDSCLLAVKIKEASWADISLYSLTKGDSDFRLQQLSEKRSSKHKWRWRFSSARFDACCYLKAREVRWIMHPFWQRWGWAHCLNPRPTDEHSYTSHVVWGCQLRDSLLFYGPITSPHVRWQCQGKSAEYGACF